MQNLRFPSYDKQNDPQTYPLEAMKTRQMGRSTAVAGCPDMDEVGIQFHLSLRELNCGGRCEEFVDVLLGKMGKTMLGKPKNDVTV